MARINYQKLQRKARKLIRDNGAQFTVDNRKGYAVKDAEAETWRDGDLIETTEQTFLTTIEVSVGSIIEFVKSGERMRVTSCRPTDPNGVVIIWSLTASV